MVRKKTNKVTLAIGDGANDISMIQRAHVGIGIQGIKGNQASVFSDFAIARFKDVRRLMFYHGRSFAVREFIFIQLTMFRAIMHTASKVAINTEN